MGALRKITINLPADLVADSMARTGKGVTETIREALEARRYDTAWERVRVLREQMHIPETWQELRGKFDKDRG